MMGLSLNGRARSLYGPTLSSQNTPKSNPIHLKS
ncbi:hypothetical protein CVT26_004188 [Gymnopilus dilepis]|uniref:Uncharacterized protein n=1 Tax=Gymnopilus dilepis TaxID=231916 RepID=A0A409WN40_9AGAR|nr:hypothetical protein CVT26_004188 [Gymnopilus dilepis]